MSSKRAASSELNHDNWDKEDPKDHEEIGTFKPAPREVLEKRVIRTARRRTTQSSNDEKKKSVFSGFGFNKTQPTSFDFLANLTKPNDKSETDTSTAPVFNSPALTGGPFGNPASLPKSSSTLFQMPPNTESTTSTLFSNKSSGSMFSPTVSTSNNPINFGTPSSTNTLFAKPSNSADATPSGLFSSKTNSSSMFGTTTSTSNNAPSSTTSPLFAKPTNGEVTKPSGLFSSTPNSGTSGIASSLFTKPSDVDGTPPTGLFGSKPTNIFNAAVSTSNITNSGTTQNTPTLFAKQTDSECTPPSGVFSSKKKSTNIFSAAVSSTTNTVYSETTPKTTALFQISSTNNANAKSIFSTADSSAATSVFKTSDNSSLKVDPPKRPNQEPTSVFGCSAKRIRESGPSVNSTTHENVKGDKRQDNTNKVFAFHSRLKELNITVLKWITKHVNESPICILSPVFSDYDKYVKRIREEYDQSYENYIGDRKEYLSEAKKSEKPSDITPVTKKSQPSFSFGIQNTTSSAANSSSNSLASSIFGDKAKPPTEKQQSFTFGIKTTSSTTTTNPTLSVEGSFKLTDNKARENQTKSDSTSSVNEITREIKANETSNQSLSKFSFGITNSTTSTETGAATFSFTNKTSSPTGTVKPFGIENVKTAVPVTNAFSFTNETSSPSNKVETFGIKSVTPKSNTLSFTNTSSNPTNKVAPFRTEKEMTAEATAVITSTSSNNAVQGLVSEKSSISTTTLSNKKDDNESVTPANQTSQSSPFSLNTSSSPFAAFSNKSPFSATSTPSTGFVFGSANTLSTSTPFSFGGGKPFSFSSSVQQKPETTEKAEENEEPPKVEYNPVVENNSVYEKKCKIFIKKDDEYIDKGVGTLYIKKVDDNAKHQLLVRANTNLGTILINLLLASAIPCQRMGKNNVMLVCIPTPDSKPPPTPVLIRVKTSEEADELLETLNKYKV